MVHIHGFSIPWDFTVLIMGDFNITWWCNYERGKGSLWIIVAVEIAAEDNLGIIIVCILNGRVICVYNFIKLYTMNLCIIELLAIE